MNTKKYYPSGLKNLFLFLAITAAGIGSASAQVCTNGSAVDCNTAGSTLIASSAFVDPTPPAGYTQCAGFINTPGDDVRWDWENNCAGLVDETGGGLFMRVYDDATGAILSGASLYSGVSLTFPPTGFNFRTELNEGEGFLDNPDLLDSFSGPGTSLVFSDTDVNVCSCGRPPSGSGTCNDIFTATTANDKIFYVGGNSTNDAYEAVYGPPGGKNTCSLTNEIVALRVAIYAGAREPATGTLRFNVTKTFTDDAPGDVEVTLTCNSGIPLVQSAIISGGDPAGVTFVLTEVQDAADCEVTETGSPDGYVAVFNNGAGCAWSPVTEELNTCSIENRPEPATFIVNKVWDVTEEGGGDDVIRTAEITITCDAEIVGGYQDDDDRRSEDFAAAIPMPGYGDWMLDETIVGDGFVEATVDTSMGPATCSAEETSEQSGVESTSDCGPREIGAGETSECTITNTVFFEGIPSLNQYGLAIMALLMMGLGMVGFRRFV